MENQYFGLILVKMRFLLILPPDFAPCWVNKRIISSRSFQSYMKINRTKQFLLYTSGNSSKESFGHVYWFYWITSFIINLPLVAWAAASNTDKPSLLTRSNFASPPTSICTIFKNPMEKLVAKLTWNQFLKFHIFEWGSVNI